jgi:hypothetical protein
MKILIPFLILLLTACSAHSNSTNYDYRGVFIGMPVDKALHLLPNYMAGKAQFGCYYLQVAEGDTSLYIMIIDDTVVRFDVLDKEANILTQKGIGATKLEILKRYPQAKVKPHEYLGDAGEYLEVTLTSGNALIFETEFDIVAQYRFGRYPEVQYIEGCL